MACRPAGELEEVEFLAEEVADAKVTCREDTLSIIEDITVRLLEELVAGETPTLHLISRTERNVTRDIRGHTHLGRDTTTKTLFGGRKASGSERYAKIWQVLSFVQRLVVEGKLATQREAYYCLVQHFKNQVEFNNTLQDVVALTRCTRSSLGLCASSSGVLAGCVMWKEEGVEAIDCSVSRNGKRIPGLIEGVTFESLGARYILVVEKDAVFTYLCGQRLWDSLPCVLVTGCGYPSLCVRAVVSSLSTQLGGIPILGLFDYNPHGVQILLTYKFGSVRMGMEAHAYAVDQIRWLGLHYTDILEEGGRPKVDPSALQPWGPSDSRVFGAVQSRVGVMMEPLYSREIAHMDRIRVKAEIEALTNSGSSLDSLENTIIHKIMHKMYF